MVGGVIMATSTFGKQFVVERKKQDEFISEMTKVVTSTLPKDFQSKSVHLHQNSGLKENLLKVLGENDKL